MKEIKYPDNWDSMTQEEKEKWVYINSTPSGRHSNNIKEASRRLADLILNDAELSKIKISEITDVLGMTAKILGICYGQLSLRQARENIDSLPESEVSYSRLQALR